MAKQVFCLKAWDHQAKPKVIVSYLAGWKGLLPETAWNAAPEGVFQEVERNGQSRKP